MCRILAILLLLILPEPLYGQQREVEVPGLVLTGVPFQVKLQRSNADGDSLLVEDTLIRIAGATYNTEDTDGALIANTPRSAVAGLVLVEVVHRGAVIASATTRAIPGWVSILPPLVAILIALLFKRVIPALFLGVWIGAWVAAGFSLPGMWSGLLDSFQVYVLQSLANEDHASILLFSLMIGGMVGIISKNGGTQGVVNHIVRWASNASRGQLAASLLGLAIFFDDYANTLVVGNTMRPVTDRLRISREKLAYIVDSTAAPVACVAFVTTWIGYEVGLVGTAVAQIDGFNESAYFIFLNSILYSFYPLLAIFFVFAVALTGRDFGPMYTAEQRARTTGQVLSENAKVDDAAGEGKELAPKEGKPQRVVNAVLPVGVMVVSVLAGLYATGEGATLRDIIGSADSYKALMWASLLGVLTAGVLSVGQRILSIDETVEAWYAGLKSMLFAMIILVLAWALSSITEVLHTADYLITALGSWISPGIVPMLVFFLAAATSFATGSSWGTMGILMPLVIPLAWAVLEADGLHTQAEHYHIIYSTVSAVLSGAVWGDHCSPISDTTILSSMASGCDHIDHVRTQLPYAVLVGLVSAVFGTLPVGFGMSWWVGLVVGIIVLAVGLRYFGSKTEDSYAMHPAPVSEETTSP